MFIFPVVCDVKYAYASYVMSCFDTSLCNMSQAYNIHTHEKLPPELRKSVPLLFNINTS